MYCDLKSVRGILIPRKKQNFNNLKQNFHKQDHCSNENISSVRGWHSCIFCLSHDFNPNENEWERAQNEDCVGIRDMELSAVVPRTFTWLLDPLGYFSLYNDQRPDKKQLKKDRLVLTHSWWIQPILTGKSCL